MGQFSVEDWISFCQALSRKVGRSQFLLLCYIAAYPNQKLNDISRNVRWSYSYVSKNLSLLVKGGYIERRNARYKITGT